MADQILGKLSKLSKSDLLNIVKNQPTITINNLYEKYSDFKIDLKKEQELFHLTL